MFNHKHLPTLIYLGILMTLLALTFNLVGILQESRSITGYAVAEESTNTMFRNIDIKAFIEENILDSQTPSKIYNAIVVALFISIFLILIRFIYKAQTYE